LFTTCGNLLVQTEVGFLARVSHPNIVELLGYCQAEGDKELLVKCGHKMVMVAAMSSMAAVKHGCKVRHGRLPNH
jgi:serine/threonine protein kinase